MSPLGTYWLNPSGKWTKTKVPFKQGTLVDLTETVIFDQALPIGVYAFFALIENNPDGVFNPIVSLSANDNVFVYSKGGQAAETEGLLDFEDPFLNPDN
jgi:hypothetical protein